MQARANPSLASDSATMREEIDACLERLTEFPECEDATRSHCPPRLKEAIRYMLLAPGKRLRPTLCVLAAEACGATPDIALPAACAVEMVHVYSLVHDDLPAMDDDDLRRGRPTCHRQFDEATAVLAGDALLALAFETLATEVHPPETAARCCAELAVAAGAKALVGGQVDDLDAERSGSGQATLENLHRIHARKTGAMILVSLRLGGQCAGADPTQMAALDAYGRRLGLAFQIVDDLLDVEGDADALGKRVQKDAGRGKLTYPGLLGVEASRRRAEELVGEAVAALAALAPHASRLEALARFVIERDR